MSLSNPPSSRPGPAEKPGFSIICAHNDQAKLDRFLLDSLREQSTPYEILTVDTSRGGYECAARILNVTALSARYDYLMFVHHDIALRGSDWLARVHDTLSTLGNFGAAGVAGRSEGGIESSVWHGSPPRFAGGTPVKRPEPVQTLDGCLLLVRKSVFMEQGFDEETCPGWHLYVADYCLDLARRGLPVYVLPHQVYHELTGPTDPGVYATTLNNILKKHCDHHKKVYLTVGIWDADTQTEIRPIILARVMNRIKSVLRR